MNRLQILYQIVPVLEALEKGVSDISNWLNEANKIIASYGIPSSPQAIAVLQGKHKVIFFTLLQIFVAKFNSSTLFII